MKASKQETILGERWQIARIVLCKIFQTKNLVVPTYIYFQVISVPVILFSVDLLAFPDKSLGTTMDMGMEAFLKVSQPL